MKQNRTPTDYALWAALPMAQTSEIEGRLTMILDKSRSRRTLTGRLLIAACAFGAVALVPLAMLKPTAKADVAASASEPPALPGFQKTFASGITVALNALAERHAYGGQWWQPNGVLLPGPNKLLPSPYKNPDALFVGWGPNQHPRALMLTRTAPRDMDYSEAVQFLVAGTPPEPVWSVDFSEQFHKRRHSITEKIQDFPVGAKVCTLRYGIAAGPWKTVAVQKVHFTPASLQHRTVAPDKDYVGDVYLELSKQPRLIYKDAAGVWHNLPFLPHPIGKVARQIVAINTNGTVIPLIGASSAPFSIIPLAFSEHSFVHKYNPNVDLTQIRELRLQTRPYEWAEFKDIALQPAK